MYYDDHPPAHFHAAYGEREAKIAIEGFEVKPLNPIPPLE